MKEETLITIATFENALQAHIVAARLRSEGIEIYIFNEYMSSILPIGNAVSSVELKIAISDAERASYILRLIDEMPDGETEH